MKVEDSIWDKLTRLVVGLLLVAGIVAIGVWYLPLIRQNENYRKEVLRLDNEVAKESELRRQLTTQVDALNNDTNTIIRIARESLGVAKPGETVIRFEESVPTNSATNRN